MIDEGDDDDDDPAYGPVVGFGHFGFQLRKPMAAKQSLWTRCGDSTAHVDRIAGKRPFTVNISPGDIKTQLGPSRGLIRGGTY